MSDSYKPVVLCILDGWGIGDSKDESCDAIKQAHTPYWNYLLKSFPHSKLSTSGEDVGLPKGQMGNSEVGHMTIGSGRVVYQDLVRINHAIQTGELKNNKALQELISYHIITGKSVHLLGLCSDGGVHSHIDHIIFIAKLLSAKNISVKLHLFLDGRDVSPESAALYLKQVDSLISEFKNIKISTVSGRFYAMDRDSRLDRTELSFRAIAKAEGIKIDNWQDYLESQYSQNISDEFFLPASFKDYTGIHPGDSLLFANFRSDRIRQLVQKLLESYEDLEFKIGMTHYSSDLDKVLTSLFLPQYIHNGLGEVISLYQKKQLRASETEKYAHVTFFFNGGREEPYLGEDRILVPSPKVKTYDLLPEMASLRLTDELVEAIALQKYDLIIVNYANADMVGHSGKLDKAIEAVEAIDKVLAKLHKAISHVDGILLITADHGNIECMFDKVNNVPHTSHTTNPVPFLLVANDLCQSGISLKDGNLSDIAPTILRIMNIKQPIEMTGSSLL